MGKEMESIIDSMSPLERENMIKKLVSQKGTTKTRTIKRDVEKRFVPYTLSDIQASYWVEDKSGLYLGDRQTNIYVNIEISASGALISRFVKLRLEKAVNTLVSRHDILKTVIQKDFKQQTLSNTPKFKVEFNNYHRCLDSKSILERQKRDLITNRIDYDKWPLFRIIITNWKDKITIQFGISPLLMDGDGVEIFLSQLTKLVFNSRTKLPQEFNLTYRDYVTFSQEDKVSSSYNDAKKNKLRRLEMLPKEPRLPLSNILGKGEDKLDYKIDKIVLLDSTNLQVMRSRVVEKKVTLPAVLTAIFSDAVAKRAESGKYYMGVVNTYHLPELDVFKSKILGNFNTIDFIEINCMIGTFYERVKYISNQFAFNHDNGRYSGLKEIKEFRRKRRIGRGVTFPVAFNCTINISHQSSSEVLKSNKFVNRLINKYKPRIQELNIYMTQLPFFPTIELSEKGELICKFARYEDYFAPGVLKDIMNTFKENLYRFMSEEGYWNYSWEETIRANNYQKEEKLPAVVLDTAKELERNLKSIQIETMGENICKKYPDNIELDEMDSMQVVQFCSKINEKISNKVTPRLLMESKDLTNLAIKIVKEEY